MISFLTHFAPIIPEIWIGLIAIFCLILGLYKTTAKAIWWISGSLLIIVFCMILNFFPLALTDKVVLGGIFNSSVGMWEKMVLILFTLLLLIFHGGVGRVKYWDHGHHEYVCLLLLSLAASMIAISARDFLILYAALELSALVGYVLASYDRERIFSTESGMKYLVLGSFMSAIMAFGMSYIYGFGGSLLFADIKELLVQHNYSVGLLTGIMLFSFGILFKLSIAPFHFWTQDVYQGSPFLSVAYFSSIPKFTALIILINILEEVLFNFKHELQDILLGFATLSMVIGGFGAIIQKSLKRLIGYSAILNSGFTLAAIAMATNSGYGAAIMYQIIYSVCTIGLIAALAITSDSSAEDYEISNLAGFGAVKKVGAFAIAVFAFSLCGMPPLAGFFGKYYVVSSLLESEHYMIAIITLIISVISSYYYINIVKQMYFCLPAVPQIRVHESSSIALVIFISLLFVALFPIIA